MDKAGLQITEVFRGENSEERKRILQERLDQYLRIMLEGEDNALLQGEDRP